MSKSVDTHTAEFFSVFEKKDTVEITVRAPKQDNGHAGLSATCAMSKADFKSMMQKILGRLK